jgi:hypothetical protein
MIDILDKTEALMARLKAALPVRARPTPEVLKALRQRSPGRRFPRRCDITEIYYAGDEGGILCTLDFGLDDRKEAHIVSITHLRFDGKSALSRAVTAYQRHRVKKLEQLHGRPF